MKIVHIVEPLAGGIVTFIQSLVENLPEDLHTIVHGERKQVTPFEEVKAQLTYPNVKFIRWKSAQRSLRLKADISAAIELYSILKRLKKNNALDIVHLHSSKGGFIGRVVCRILGIQHLVVYTPNGAPFLGNASRFSNYLYKRLEKLASIFGGQVVCCSPSEQKSHQLAGIKALIINNGTSSVHQEPEPGIQKSNVFKIVTSGRIVDQKNPSMFNRIAAYFEDFKQFEFIWAGDGTDRHLLTAKNIRVTGWMGKDQLNKIVSHADMYLSTAIFEGLPFSVLEALALKNPVLVTDCVGNKDLVTEGLNGCTFRHESEAINKILQFYNNSSMLRIMGEHSAAYCKKAFDYADTGKRYKRLYQKAAFKYSTSLIHLNHLAHGNN